MESIGHAIASADAIKSFVHSEIRKPDNKVKDKHEATLSNQARAQTIEAIDGIVSMVDGTLANLRPAKKPSAKGKPVLAERCDAIQGAEMPQPYAVSAVPPMSSSAIESVERLKIGMSADKDKGLGCHLQGLQNASQSIAPIVSNFDSVLKRPYLENYSATLNTVPVVGLKNGQIMYLATELDSLGKGGTKETWKFFSPLPSDAKVTDPNLVHFFPYKGDLCVSVGRAAWKKKHRLDKDPAIGQAVDNWPRLYLNEWEKIGDNVFPAEDLQDIVPFAELTADGNDLSFHLLILTKDSEIQVLNNDDLCHTNDWATLCGNSAVSWSRIAYWSGSITAVDQQSNIWELQVNLKANTYKSRGKTQMEPTSEFTATDLGPVAVRKDGYLYKRYLQNPDSDSGDQIVKWTKWIAQDGVTRLGVASPGVILNLRLLTQTLRSRYLDTQTSIYPVVRKIQGCARAHCRYEEGVLQKVQEHRNADNETKQRIAKDIGATFLAHAVSLSKFMNTATSRAKGPVNKMTNQLRKVKSDLESQLFVLKDKLKSLKNTLEVQEEALGRLTAAFWGSVAAMFLGLVFAIVGASIGVGIWFLVGAGALFIGGIIAMQIFKGKIEKLRKDMSETQNQIAHVTEAVRQMSEVVNSFADLSTFYSTLNQFWGSMYNDAKMVGDFDEMTREQIGDGIIQDESSIQSSIETCKEIFTAAGNYIDVLTGQGVTIPDTDTLLPELEGLPPLGRHVLPWLEKAPLGYIMEAQTSLENGDFMEYEKQMDNAWIAELIMSSEKDALQMRSGLWHDIAALNTAAAIFNPAPHLHCRSSQEIDELAHLQRLVTTTERPVAQAVHQIVAMCEATQQLVQKYKSLPDQRDMQQVRVLKDTLLQEALQSCSRAQSAIAGANNAFVQVNRSATEYQQDFQVRHNALVDSDKATKEAMEILMRNTSPPWYVVREGPTAILAYSEQKRCQIEEEFQPKLDGTTRMLEEIDSHMQNGHFFQGHSLTWAHWAQSVSGYLGDVYGILAAIDGQVMADPTLYTDLFKVEWGQVKGDSDIALSLLAAQGVAVFHKGTRLAASKIPTAASDTRQVVEALSATDKLAKSVDVQSTDAGKFFSRMENLEARPYLSAIIGEWDGKNGKKTTLQDTVMQLHNEYVSMVSQQYPAVFDLRTFSRMQKARVELFAEGSLSLEQLVEYMLKGTLKIQTRLQETDRGFRRAAQHYQAVLKRIRSNMKQIRDKIEQLDVDIEKLDKERADAIVGVIADIFALAFATAILFTSLGFLGPVGEVLGQAAAFGLTATATAAAIKTILDGLKLAQIVQVISTMQGTKETLEDSLSAMEAVEPLFEDIAKSIHKLDSRTEAMVKGLCALINNSHHTENVKLSTDDIEKIGNSWEEVYNASQRWLNTVNKQGIEPPKSLFKYLHACTI